jgi:hypothetical protein
VPAEWCVADPGLLAAANLPIHYRLGSLNHASAAIVNNEPAFLESLQNRTRGGYARIDQVTLSRHRPNGHFGSGLGFNLNVENDSRRLNFVEKWFPGERLTVGLVKIPIL